MVLTALMAADRLVWRGPPSQAPLFKRRMALVERLHQGGGCVEPRPLTELDRDATRQDFLDASHGYRRPVVVRGFVADSIATRTWTRSLLAQRLGDREVTVLRFDVERDWDVGAPTERMRFDEYLERSTTEPLYLNSSTELATEDLLNELGLPRVNQRLQGSGWDELALTNLFIGGPHVHSALHAAPAGNFFLNAVGRKRWTLTDPRLSPWLAPVMKPPYQYVRSAFGGYRDGDERLNNVPRFQATLEPGDLLYNAPWWWHEVDNLSPLTVGCSIRRVPPPFRPDATWANHRAFTAMSVYPATRIPVLAHAAWSRLNPRARPLRELMNRANTWIQARTLRSG